MQGLIFDCSVDLFMYSGVRGGIYMKKILVTLIAVLLVLTGCSSKPPVDTESEKIVIWAWDESFNIAAALKAKEYYTGKAEVEVVTMSQDDIVQKLNTSLSSNSTEGLPNIVLIEDYKIQGYLKSFPDAFADLNSVVDDSKFADFKLAVTKKDGINYGVPFDSGVVGLFYRTDLFAEAGYTHEDLTDITWEEYIEMGKKVYEATGIKLATLDPSDIGQVRMMLQTAGSWYVDGEENVTLEGNQALKDALKLYKDMVDADVTKVVSTWDEFVGAFNSGEVASVPTGAWIASSVRNGEDQAGKWGVVPMPRMGSNSKSVNRSNIGGSSWYVLDKVAGKDEAIKFLGDTFATSEALMNDLAADINMVSTMKSAVDQPNYQKEDTFFNNQILMEELSEWTAEIPGVNYGYNTYLIEEILQGHLLEYVNGKKDLDTILKDAQLEASNAIVK